ncbi:MAG TPA: LLM class flavin-dependent oxidoreductase [Thermoleophilaceae bacterium]|nr:LLM class flavin-dependent oxidoreductase [Thermoleophilaceae bacterium]
MDVGIGLPSTIPGVQPGQVPEWARRAEAAGFSTLGTIDRIVYPNQDPLIALAHAAAVTERIRLTTAILILPYRQNAALVAKQAASLQHLSGGRLVLGAAIGARDDDYSASGVPMEGRGERFEEMLGEMKRVWSGEEYGYAGAIGPDVREGPPPLIIGGQVDAAYRRAAEFGEGWMRGGGGPEGFAEGRAKLEEAWEKAGRDGKPRALSLAYFSLGGNAREQADWYIHDYYGFAGPYADMLAQATATDADTVRAYVESFAEQGCDELILFPCSSDPHQVELLAEAAL